VQIESPDESSMGVTKNIEANSIVEPIIPEHEIELDQRNAIIQKIRNTKLTLAALLEQVYKWSISGDLLVLSLESRYAGDTLKAEQALILIACSEIIPDIKNLIINVTERVVVSIPHEKTDSRVEKIREAFRGEIVDEGAG